QGSSRSGHGKGSTTPPPGHRKDPTTHQPGHGKGSTTSQPGYGKGPTTHQPGYGKDRPTHQPGYGKDRPTHQPGYGTDRPTHKSGSRKERPTHQSGHRRPRPTHQAPHVAGVASRLSKPRALSLGRRAVRRSTGCFLQVISLGVEGPYEDDWGSATDKTHARWSRRNPRHTTYFDELAAALLVTITRRRSVG